MGPNKRCVRVGADVDTYHMFPLYAYTFIHICIYTYILTYIYIYIHAYTHTHTQTCRCVNMYVYRCVHYVCATGFRLECKEQALRSKHILCTVEDMSAP